MKNEKLNKKRLLFEFISITFAVLFALFVNQWRENHNNDKLSQKAVLNIRQELEENKEDILLLLPQHTSALALIDSLIAVNESSGTPINESIPVELRIMSSSAWEISEITNALFYLDFDDVNSLAKVYDLQSYYESIVKHYILNSSITYQSKSDVKRLKNNKQFLETLIPIENDLEFFYGIMLTEVLTE